MERPPSVTEVRTSIIEATLTPSAPGGAPTVVVITSIITAKPSSSLGQATGTSSSSIGRATSVVFQASASLTLPTSSSQSASSPSTLVITSPSSPSTGPSAGLIAGAVIGGVAVAVLIGIFILLYLRHKRFAPQSANDEVAAVEGGQTGMHDAKQTFLVYEEAELGTDTSRSELPDHGSQVKPGP